MMGWKQTVAVVVTLIVVACAPHDDETKDTPESRCQRICAASASGPCAGKTNPSCSSACIARLAGKSDACQSCLHSRSGWKGVSCSCDNALGSFGSITCKTCKWTGASKACTSDVTGDCSGTPQGCEGLVLAPIGEPECSSACGEVPVVDAGSD